MERRTFLSYFPKGIIIGAAATHALKSYANSAVCKSLECSTKRKKKPTDILKEMYREVKELGSYDNEDFIKREFHINLDGNDINKEEHVVVLINSVGGKERMLVQVTYFEPKKIRFIKYPKDIKVVLCHMKEDKIEIEKCDYSKKEIKSLLPNILQGIRDKKKILKLIDNGIKSRKTDR